MSFAPTNEEEARVRRFNSENSSRGRASAGPPFARARRRPDPRATAGASRRTPWWDVIVRLVTQGRDGSDALPSASNSSDRKAIGCDRAYSDVAFRRAHGKPATYPAFDLHRRTNGSLRRSDPHGFMTEQSVGTPRGGDRTNPRRNGIPGSRPACVEAGRDWILEPRLAIVLACSGGGADCAGGPDPEVPKRP